jgi:hypothetical protein
MRTSPIRMQSQIAREWGVRPPAGLSIESSFSDGIGACMNLLLGLYDFDDLRKSETDRLDDLAEQAINLIRADARRRINEALVSAALAFAAEHPDAPRATREAAAAA